MSISSLMTATLPQSSNFHHHNHHSYTSDLGSYAPNHSLPNVSSRLAQSHSFPNTTPSLPRKSVTLSSSRQLPPPKNMPTPHSNPPLQYTMKRERERDGPNWDEFYKNGPPKEIIVIDDDSPEPTQKRKENNPSGTTRALDSGVHEPVAKKRRTANQAAYERTDYGTYSNARTYSLGDSGSNTRSTDRTSLQTTAPTSLGSHSSHGNNGGGYIEDGTVGQKRKRVTRGQVAVEKKQKEIKAIDVYHPPPKPPIKAKDVHVPAIRDVRKFRSSSNALLTCW